MITIWRSKCRFIVKLKRSVNERFHLLRICNRSSENCIFYLGFIIICSIIARFVLWCLSSLNIYQPVGWSSVILLLVEDKDLCKCCSKLVTLLRKAYQMSLIEAIPYCFLGFRVEATSSFLIKWVVSRNAFERFSSLDIFKTTW